MGKNMRFLSIRRILLIGLVVVSLVFSLSAAQDLTVEDIGLSTVFYLSKGSEDHRLSFISYSDDNDVWVYALDDGNIKLETEFTLDSLTRYTISTIGQYLKVVSEEPIMVCLYQDDPGVNYESLSYYPGETGKFVDKTFNIFTVSPILEIYALEDGFMEITNETGTVALLVFHNTYVQYNVTQDSHYTITSEVDLILNSDPLSTWEWQAAPSTTGQFVGKIHYGYARAHGAFNKGSVFVIAYDPGEVTITNLQNSSDTIQHIFQDSGETWYYLPDIYPYDAPLKIEGDIDTYVQTGYSESYDIIYSGTNYVGGRVTDDNNIEYWFYVALEREGVIFAPEDVTFTINGTETEMEADEYKLLPGHLLYHVVSSKPLVILTQDVNNLGYVVVPSGIPDTKPEVAEEAADNTMIYIAIAVAAIVVVAILGFLLMKRKG
jgi:hypothetical protein